MVRAVTRQQMLFGNTLAIVRLQSVVTVVPVVATNTIRLFLKKSLFCLPVFAGMSNTS
jgi:type IV secretory pathway VirB3-like protein